MSDSVPEGWKSVKLSDVAEETSDRVDNPSKSGYDRFVGLDHLDGGELTVRRWGSTADLLSAMKLFKSGDILIGRRNAYLKRASKAEFDGVCSGDAYVVREKSGTIAEGLLPIILNSDSFWDYTIAHASGTMSKRAKWRDLAEYSFLLPSLEEQRRIATTLWAAEDCIVKGELFIGAAESVKKLLVKKIFSEGLNHSKFKQIAEIGKIPADWRVVRLEDTSKAIIVPMRDKPKKFDGSIPWCRLEDIDGKYLYKSKSGQNVDTDTISEMNLKVFPKGTLICACSAVLGVCAIAGNPLVTNQRFIGIVPNDSLDSEFLYYILEYYTPRLLAQSTGTIFCNIPRKNFEDFKIPLPPFHEQRQIAAILTRCDDTIAAARANVMAAKALKMKMINEMLGTEGV